MDVGSESADLCLVIAFGLLANCCLMCGCRLFASIRCFNILNVVVISRIWYRRFVLISCCSWCISVKSFRSVTYSLVTSETDSNSSITDSTSASASSTGCGRTFFSTWTSFEDSVSSCVFALSTYNLTNVWIINVADKVLIVRRLRRGYVFFVILH